MKKLIIKLAAFSIISVLLSANAALANGSAGYKMDDKLDFAKNAQCIDQTPLTKGTPEVGPPEENPPPDETCEDSTKDICYLVTFIEEPLDTETDESDPNFKKRICYRHTLQWTDKILGIQTKEELSTKKCQTLGQGELASISAQTITDLEVKYSCRQIQAVLSKGGTSLLYGYIGMVYRWGASMVGIVAVLVIVISGIQISAGGGDPEAINSAKKRIIQSIAGIVVLFLSGLILYTINPTFFTK